MSSDIWNAIPKRLPVGRQRVDLHEREPAQGSAGHARGLEEPSRFLPYVLQVRLDLDGSPVRPVLLQLSRRQPHGGLGERADEPGVAYARELRESLGEEVVARGRGDLAPVSGDGGRHAPPGLGPVHDVVVYERRRVQHLDGGGGGKEMPPVRLTHPGAEDQQQRPQTLAPRGQSLEGRRDELCRRPLADRDEEALDLVYGVEGALGQRGAEVTSVRRIARRRGGA